MKAVKKKKIPSGSVKIDPEIHAKMVELCEKKGWKITPFASKAIEKEVERVKSED